MNYGVNLDLLSYRDAEIRTLETDIGEDEFVCIPIKKNDLFKSVFTDKKTKEKRTKLYSNLVALIDQRKNSFSHIINMKESKEQISLPDHKAITIGNLIPYSDARFYKSKKK